MNEEQVFPPGYRASISLRALSGLSLIIDVQPTSGITYINQVGGHHCLQVGQEGILVPLSQGYYGLEKDLRGIFEGAGSKYKSFGAVHGIDNEDKNLINQFFSDYRLAQSLKVDEENLENSYEAWLSVEVTDYVHGLFSYNNSFPVKGVLTWQNSD